MAGQAKIPHAVRRLLLDALQVRDHHQDLLAHRRNDDVIDATCVEITDDQPLLPAANDRDDRDDRDDREMIAAAPGRQAHLDSEIAACNGSSTRCWRAARRTPPTRSCSNTSKTSAITC